MRCYVFDLDGTLADHSHRVHHITKHPKDWDAYYAALPADPPIPHMVELVRGLFTPVIYISGRRELYRMPTIDWLFRHGLPVGMPPHARPSLYLRPDDDRRPTEIVKVEAFCRATEDGWEPIMVFDDRTKDVEAYRNLGVPCLQVAMGDY